MPGLLATSSLVFEVDWGPSGCFDPWQCRECASGSARVDAQPVNPEGVYAVTHFTGLILKFTWATVVYCKLRLHEHMRHGVGGY